jgi:hypothetical protein
MADDFQPRFVDLVRVYTSTEGTGNFEPGVAVVGYRSFASAVQPGESFYYSAMGIDKPGEFEIGRGTMQADGTISRDPVGGAFTDFTAGSKTLALVAAAEWYEMVHAGLTAAVQSVQSRDLLAALSDRSTPALLLEKGREGLFVFESSDHSSEVATDLTQGVFLAPAFDITGASGAWLRKYRGGADPRWFGAALDGVTDDKLAFSAAINIARHVRIPQDRVLRTTGEVILPDGAFIEGGTIDFDATDYANLFTLRDNLSDIRIEGINFISSSDVPFAHIVRMVQDDGTTLDGLDFVNNTITYSPPSIGSGDRWVVAGTGSGARKNIRINGNRVAGPMQLIATPVATGTFRDSEICFNRVHNARSNAISLLGSGAIGSPCTLDNVKVTDNVITADNYTSIGIGIGIDDTGGGDKNVNIKNLTIARNTIDITGSGIKTADIFIRLGNKCAGVGGFDSVNDSIIIDSNELHYGISWQQSDIADATLSRVTNHVFSNNKVLGGDVCPAYMANDARFVGNTLTDGAPLRLGPGNGRIVSVGNSYGTLSPLNGNSEFEWQSHSDTYLGSAASTDRVVALSANVDKAQKAYFDNCTIDSYTTAAFGQRSAIYTTGAGNPAVHVRNLTSSTDWGLCRYEVDTGSITDYTGGRWFSAAYDPPALAAGAVDAVQTMSAPGARVGDEVRIVFSQALQGLRLEAWIPAADMISYRFSNPGDSAVDLPAGTVRVTFVSAIG